MTKNVHATLNEALGVSQERYKAFIDETSQEIIRIIKSGKEAVNIKDLSESIIGVVRQDHLNTAVPPSNYELELFFQGYCLGRLLCKESFHQLELQAMSELHNESKKF